VNFGIGANPPTPPPAGWRDRIGEVGGSGVCETDGAGIGIMFGDCDWTHSSKGGEYKVSRVSYRVCCRLGPLPLGGDGRKDTGRGGTGRISDTGDSVPIAWVVDARKGC